MKKAASSLKRRFERIFLEIPALSAVYSAAAGRITAVNRKPVRWKKDKTSDLPHFPIFVKIE